MRPVFEEGEGGHIVCGAAGLRRQDRQGGKSGGCYSSRLELRCLELLVSEQLT